MCLDKCRRGQCFEFDHCVCERTNRKLELVEISLGPEQTELGDATEGRTLGGGENIDAGLRGDVVARPNRHLVAGGLFLAGQQGKPPMLPRRLPWTVRAETGAAA
jgi:hypothetical protein